MANNITLAEKYLPILDTIYKQASKTAMLDSLTQRLDFLGADTVKIFRVSSTGLGDYDRNTGYPKGDVTGDWQTMQLTQSRGKEISVDRMDNEETLGQMFGAVTGQFMREHVVPEVDAYRFAKYANGAGTKVEAALTPETILDTLEAALLSFNNNEVSEEGRYFFMDYALQPLLARAVSRSWESQDGISRELNSYNSVPITWVPSTRFYTGIEMNSGQTNWGYSKAADATGINFMLLQTAAITQAVKLSLPKIFTPDENQDKDAWKFQFRLYHDAFTFEKKVNGIYVCTNPA